MANELATTQTFQQKMFERIRDQIGELMSDDDLRRLVEIAMQKAFFEPVEVKDSYGYRIRYDDPLFLQLIRKQMQSQVDSALKAWLEGHKEDVTKAIDVALGKGMFGMVQSYIDYQFSGPFQNLAAQLREKGIIT